MAQNETTLARLAPFTGAVFVALAVVGGIIGFFGVDWMAPGEEVAAHFVDNTTQAWTGAALIILSAPFLLWFLGSLWRRMRTAEGSPARLSVVMFGGGVAVAGSVLLSGIVWASGAGRASEDGALDPVYAALSFDLGGLLWGGAAPVALAVVLLSFAVLAIRAGTHPAWWAWLTGVVGVALLILPIAWAVMAAGMAWILVMSIWLGVEGWRAG